MRVKVKGHYCIIKNENNGGWWMVVNNYINGSWSSSSFFFFFTFMLVSDLRGAKQTLMADGFRWSFLPPVGSGNIQGLKNVDILAPLARLGGSSSGPRGQNIKFATSTSTTWHLEA